MIQRGFTLIEVLVAMMILAGSLLVISNTWSGNLASFRKSRRIDTINYLLKKKATELELKYQDKSLDEVPEEEKGDFGNDYPDYKWALKSKKMEFPDLAPILLSKEGGSNDQLISIVRQMTETISKSIKELKVSVFVKVGKKDQEFSVTTYLIDYNKSLSLGAGGLSSGGP